MDLMRKVLVIAFVFSLLSCKDEVPGPPPPDGPDTTSHDFSWSVDTIGTFQSSLSDAWGTGPDNVYAVGFVFLPNRSTPTNIVHWDGTIWSPIDYLEGDLRSIIGFGPNDIWVAGFWQVGQELYALIGHWDGTQWQTSIMQQHEGLFSIWGTSSSNLFACGWAGTILHFNGTAWTSMYAGTSHPLYGIWGVGNEVYSVGGDPSTGMGVLLKYQGNNVWKKMYERTYRPDSLSGDQQAIWAERGDRFFVQKYMGHDSTWVKLPVPNDNTYIQNTFGSRENNIFMVGHFGLLTHFNGSTWKRYDQFFWQPGNDFLSGGWANERTVFVVGMTGGARAIVIRGVR